MEIMRRTASAIIIITIFLISTPCLCGQFFSDDFDDYADTPLNHGWTTMGSQVSVVNTDGHNGTRGILVTYNQKGYDQYVFNKNISSLSLSEIYVRFYFKVDDPSGGCKFIKFFGVRDGDNYANTTFMINYTRGTLYEISYGDGSTISNDTQVVIRYSGEHTDANVSVSVSEGEFDPDDDEWHCFEVYMKYNDNDQRNGAYKVWIDGQLWVSATNVKNRHNDNSKIIDRVELAGYTHENLEHTWYLWYDNVVFSDEHIGPLTTHTGIVSSGVSFN
jgi:hypothetical protein